MSNQHSNAPSGHPLVLSAPHSASWFPPQLRKRIFLTDSELADGVDAGTAALVLASSNASKILGTINRLILDLNRARGDGSPDGIFRTRDFAGKPVFQCNQGLSSEEKGKLLTLFYDRFHKDLRLSLSSPSVCFFIEVHSMDSRGGSNSVTGRAYRPDIILGNFGNSSGAPEEERGFSTCSQQAINIGRDIFSRHFSDRVSSIELNGDFYGGWNTGFYGAPTPLRKSGFQIEFNKDLFISRRGHVDHESLKDLCRRFSHFVTEFGSFLCSATAASLKGSFWRQELFKRETEERSSRSPPACSLDVSAATEPLASNTALTSPSELTTRFLTRRSEVIRHLISVNLSGITKTVCELSSWDNKIVSNSFDRDPLCGRSEGDTDTSSDRLIHEFVVCNTWEYNRLPIAESTLDALVSAHTTCDLREPAKRELFSEVARVLKPHGRMVIVDTFIGEPAERAEWRDPVRVRQKVSVCHHYDPDLKDFISRCYADSSCPWSAKHDLDRKHVTTTALVLHWLACTGLFSSASVSHGSLADYVIVANRNEVAWSSSPSSTAKPSFQGNSP